MISTRVKYEEKRLTDDGRGLFGGAREERERKVLEMRSRQILPISSSKMMSF